MVSSKMTNSESQKNTTKPIRSTRRRVTRAKYFEEQRRTDRQMVPMRFTVAIMLMFCVGFIVYGVVRHVVPVFAEPEHASGDDNNDVIYEVFDVVEYDNTPISVPVELVEPAQTESVVKY